MLQAFLGLVDLEVGASLLLIMSSVACEMEGIRVPGLKSAATGGVPTNLVEASSAEGTKDVVPAQIQVNKDYAGTSSMTLQTQTF